MSVNNPAIAPNAAQQIQAMRQNQNNLNQASRTNSSVRQAALGQATANTIGPAPVTTAVSAPGSAPAPAVGGTTAPSQAGGRIAAPQAQTAQTVAVAAQAAMANPAVLGALAGVAFSSNRTRVNSISGDAKEDSGDVKVETEAEAKGELATKDTDSATGNESGDISGANSASGPST